MIFRRVTNYFLILILLCFVSCKSTPVNPDSSFPDDGFIRLVIDEKTGSFSLFTLTDPQRRRYEQLFNSREKNASYSSVSIDGNVYRLGDKNFRSALEWQGGNPVLKFESSGITVTQLFTPARTSGSAVDNGVMITYTIANSTNQACSAGLLVLIDTTLGEENRMTPFITETMSIIGETLVEGGTGGRYWISRGNNASLMGSIANPLGNSKAPDYIHFANWKRLHDSSWRLDYSEGRALGSDSAVCYIYEPVLIESGGFITYSIFLTTEDDAWFTALRQPAVTIPQTENTAPQHNTTPPVIIIPAEPVIEFSVIEDIEEEISEITSSDKPVTSIDIFAIEEEILAAAILNNENAEIKTLIKFQEILIQFLNGEIDLNEHDLLEIERAVERLRN